MKTTRLFLGLFYVALFWGNIVIEIQLVVTYLAVFVELHSSQEYLQSRRFS